MKNLKNIVFLFCLLTTFISNGQIAAVNLTCGLTENSLGVTQNHPQEAVFNIKSLVTKKI